MKLIIVYFILNIISMLAVFNKSVKYKTECNPIVYVLYFLFGTIITIFNKI